MKRRVRPSQLLVVASLALAGVGAGHVGEYLLLAPDHHERHTLLASTGHGYLPSALNAAAFIAVLGLASVFLIGLGRGLRSVGRRRGTLRWSHALPVAQMLAFTALEVGERVVAHAPLHDIAIVLALGLPLQALVGFLAGRLVTKIEEAGERLGERLRAADLHVRRSRPVRWRPDAWFRPALSAFAVAVPARGPPSDLVAA